MVRHLCDLGAALETATGMGTTALSIAVDVDAVESASVLIAAGADVNSVDIHGQTPLSLACANANTGMAFALLIAGADLDTMASLEAQWGLAGAFAGMDEADELAVLQLLHAAGLTLFPVSPVHSYHPHSMAWIEAVEGWTGLRVAAGCRLPEVARWVLETGRAGCDQTARDGLLVETSLDPSPWEGALPVCIETTALMRLAATAPFWSPAKHRICSMPVRSVVETVLQAALRFELSGGAGGLVPGEVWHGVLQALPWR